MTKYMFKKLEILIALGMLVYAVWFNLDLYKLEPTAKLDPNDNNFQYGLVDRADKIWDFAARICPKNITYPICHLSYMVDHWVPNWAQGYNLPFYYSHAPQIAIVGSYRFIQRLSSIELFTYYHLVIYILLCIFPVSMFLALRVIRLPWFVSGIGALIATHISTDGLYGIDPPSFLWRGWGLSSQLYAMIFLPLALAYGWRIFYSGFTSVKSIIRNPDFMLAVVFTVSTTLGHLGIGMVVFLSYGILAIAKTLEQTLSQSRIGDILKLAKSHLSILMLFGLFSMLFLGYWIIPTVLSNDYHNISFWDPVWKFDSYGWKEIMIRFFNGDLFDFGRFPILTLFTILGIFSAPFLGGYFPFSLLFIFWMLLYFGRTTWGGLIDIIPGMSEYHLSRFIVGIHITSLFLVPIAIWHTATTAAHAVPRWFTIAVSALILVYALPPVYRQTIHYNELNDKLITQANENEAKVRDDTQNLLKTLSTLPSGRIFAGRGGGWGKDFKVAETEMFMYLSTFGYNTVLWLPETWSPNSDTEQYFSEDQEKDYDLYNIRYVVAPPTQQTLPFWKKMESGKNWILYSVPTSGYFQTATRTMNVVSDKQSFANIVRLWIQSDMTKNQLFPQLTIAKRMSADRFTLPTIRMVDEVTYLTAQGNRQNIWNINPLYTADPPEAEIVGSEKIDTDMIFSQTVKAETGCRECIVILKQTYHPNWRASINGKSVKPIEVFPSFLAVPIQTSGIHEITFWYQPSPLKVILLVIGLVGAIVYAVFLVYTKRFTHHP